MDVIGTYKLAFKFGQVTLKCLGTELMQDIGEEEYICEISETEF